MSEADDTRFMRRALALSRQGMEGGHGGPFGAVIVKDGAIVGEGHNRVLSTNDPTAHGEVVAIRDATARLGTFKLGGCAIYTIGMPCPMCMAAIYWARIARLYYVLEPADAEAIGFDDDAFYRELAKPLGQRSLAATAMPDLRADARAIYDAWPAKADKVEY